MRVEPLVDFADQLAVEPLLNAARFVASGKQDSPAFRVEGESHAPGLLERIDTRASEGRAKLLEQAR